MTYKFLMKFFCHVYKILKSIPSKYLKSLATYYMS